VSEKYSFIDAEKADYPVVKMCAWLNVRPRASTPGGIDPPRRPRAAGLGWPCPSRRSSTVSPACHSEIDQPLVYGLGLPKPSDCGAHRCPARRVARSR
jgi:hypothetical protein